MRISQFQPSKLEEALQVIRKKHQRRGSQDIRVDKSIIDEVRTILENTESEKVPPLAWNFDKKQILACLEILAIDREGETAEKAATILITRPKEQTILRGFQKLIRLYFHKLLEKTIRSQLETKGYDILEKTKFDADRVKGWMLKKSMGRGLFADYRRTRTTERLDDFLLALPLTENDGLYSWSWRYLLKKGKKNDILRETDFRIQAEFIKNEHTPHFKRFCIHYLNELGQAQYWKEPILDLIEKNYDLPNDSEDSTNYEHPFWNEIDKAAKDELRTWLLNKRIEEFFGNDERSYFWKSQVEQGGIKNAKPILNHEGFMLDFGKFGVIEFKEIGNAAYVYPRNVFQEYWNKSKSQYYPSHFKDRERTVRTIGWYGRIIHSGGWQYNTKKRIQELLRR